jgi:hypothetical protein
MDINYSPLPSRNGLKKSSGAVIAALLLFGAVAGVMAFSPKSAFAATSIDASSDKFFGAGFIRVLITDTSKNQATDTISVQIDAKHGTQTVGTTPVTVANLGSSGTFELFITTSNAPLVPAGATNSHPVVVRVNPNSGNINGEHTDLTTGFVTSTSASPTMPTGFVTKEWGIQTSQALQDGDSIVINYGGVTKTVNFAKSTESTTVDRTIAGTNDNIIVRLNDQDANIDPTGIDTFVDTGLVSASSGTLSTAGAFFRETGQNTGVFELVVKTETGTFTATTAAGSVTAPGNEKLTVASFPSSTTFTIADSELYQPTSIISTSIAKKGTSTTDATLTFITTSPSATSSQSVTLQNSDGQPNIQGTPNLANGIKLTIVDNDMNVDTTTKDTIAGSKVSIAVVSSTGTTIVASTALTGVTFRETDVNSGIFQADTDQNKIKIVLGAIGSDGLSGSTLTLSPTTINGDPDVRVTYTDPFTVSAVSSPGTNFQKVIKISHTQGSITGVSTAGLTDKFSLTINDPDLNTDSNSVQTYSIQFTGATKTDVGATVAARQFLPVGSGTTADYASHLTFNVAGNGITPTTALTLTFIETGPNTGIFTASNIPMSTINTDAGGLKDGNQIEFIYTDNMESPAQTASFKITIGKPSTSITADKTTIPIPVGSNTDSVVLTVTDPSGNRDPNSQETLTFNAATNTVTYSDGTTGPSGATSVAISLTKSDGTTALTGLTNTGSAGSITFTETGASTGVFTAKLNIGRSGPTLSDYKDAKLKYTYDSNSVTLVMKAYDAVLSADKSSVKSGDLLTVTVSAPGMNFDPATAEKLPSSSITIQGKNDNNAVVNLNNMTETGPDTGIFRQTLTAGKDFILAAQTTVSGVTTLTESSTVKITYTDAITSVPEANIARELEFPVARQTGSLSMTPELIGPGTKAVIMLNDNDLNINPAGVDTILDTNTDWIKVTSDRSGANTAQPQAEETGPNTGMFKFTLKLSPLARSPTSSTGFATPNFVGGTKDMTGTVLPGDLISIKYTDVKDASGNKITASKVFKVQSFDPVINASSVTVNTGSSFKVTVTDQDANTDGEALDSLSLKVTSTTDPVGYSVSALETGVNTGIFTATIQTTTGVSSGSISVQTGDNIMVKYTDRFPADYSDRVKQVADPSKDFTLVVPVGVNAGGDVTATTPSNPVLKDFSNKVITEVTANQQVVLSTDISNNQDTVRPFAAIVEVRDANGITVYLQWQTGTLNAHGSTNVGLSWTPDAPGTYTVRTFVVNSIANAAALSPIASSTITVS